MTCRAFPVACGGELEALTPLLIGDGSGTPNFVRHRNGRPYIPATSLKGAIRSLAEVVGNAATPFRSGRRDDRRLDIAARTFGYLGNDAVFAGLIRFSNAEFIGNWPPMLRWPSYTVAVGQPKRTHAAFYPEQNKRKFYHHHPGTQTLTPPHPGITQTVEVTPAPPGTRFSFTVDFDNLCGNELALLLYCLILEEQATVVLSPEALGRNGEQGGTTLRGPLRHKLGGAKPHGAGSVRIGVLKQQIRRDQAGRYRGNTAEVVMQEGPDLEHKLTNCTKPFRERTDRTMRELRAMLIYHTDDPRRGQICYPIYEWFQINPLCALKPTI